MFNFSFLIKNTQKLFYFFSISIDKFNIKLYTNIKIIEEAKYDNSIKV